MYHPFGLDESTGEPLPTHVRTPAGTHLELRSEELQSEIAKRFGSSVELMKLKHGIFDDASVSVISLATIAGIGREAACNEKMVPRSGSIAEAIERQRLEGAAQLGARGDVGGQGEPAPRRPDHRRR